MTLPSHCKTKTSPHYNHPIMKLLAVVVAAIAACACSGATPSTTAGTMASQPQVPIGQLPDVDADALLGHTKVLSSDEFEGRGPGTKGEDLTVAYLVDQF